MGCEVGMAVLQVGNFIFAVGGLRSVTLSSRADGYLSFHTRHRDQRHPEQIGMSRLEARKVVEQLLDLVLGRTFGLRSPGLYFG